MDWIDIALRWYLVSLVIAVALAPAVLWLGRGLADRGASIIRPLSLLIAIWPAWYLSGIGGGLIPFSNVSLIATIVLVGGASWALGWRAGLIDRTAIRHVLIAEAGFVGLFLLFILFRGYAPQINEQEKPGDLMMLASSMRATHMPPEDAWFAGNGINYYYLGYVVLAAIAKLSGVVPWVAFNLGLATIFAMTGVAAIGLVANIVARFWGERVGRVAGVIGLFFVVLIGNPWSVFTGISQWSVQWKAFYFSGIGWTASRFIHDVQTTPPDTIISEFPAFSFVLGDLHPHLLALPYTLVALTLAWALALPAIRDTAQPTAHDDAPRLRRSPETIIRIVATGGIVGVLYAMNSWDMPTYLLVAAIALIAGMHGFGWKDRLIGVIGLGLSAVIAWLPFYAHFEAPTRQGLNGPFSALSGLPVVGGILQSVVSYTGERTSFEEYMGMFGFFWVTATILIGFEFWNRRHAETDPLETKFAIGAAVIVLFAGLLIPMPVLTLCGLIIVAAIVLIQRDPRVTAANVALVLFAVGSLISIVPEFVFLGDIYINRMNTIFKLYYQVWVLFAVASAVAVICIWATVRAFVAERGALIAVSVVTAAVMALGLVYPAIATSQYMDWRNKDRAWLGLDGLAYVDDPAEAWSAPGEYGAIQWLYDNAQKNDVMLAAGGCSWSADVGRPGGATGIPTLLGWADHEGQWHLSDPNINATMTQRATDITTLFSAGTPNTELLDNYGITLIYIGKDETSGPYAPDRASVGPECAPGPFPGASDPNFPGAGWSEVYNADGVRIYRRDGTG
ncbi:MAG: DUF2298 domain-containing protein [Thermomicrobiales bacterium]